VAQLVLGGLSIILRRTRKILG